MPLWLVVLVVIAIAIALLFVVGVRRPRSIEDELNRPSPVAAIEATPSGPASLAATIEGLTRNRATGKLEVTTGDQRCSIYFLFGRLFHAESGGLKGVDALQTALAWSHASSQFDPKAHLPSQETFLRPSA
jgi:hypothetical protein